MTCVERLEARQMLSAAVWYISGHDRTADPGDAIVIEAVPGRAGWVRATVNGREVAARPVAEIAGIRIDSNKGNDLVHVRLGRRFAHLRTVVYGGPGDDVLIGGATRDVLRGGRGDDRLHGRANANILNGQVGADHFYRGSQDIIRMNAGDQFVTQILPRMIAPAPATPPPETEPPPRIWPPSRLPDPQPLDDAAAANVSDAITKFAFAFYRKLAEQKGEENLLFSPASLVTAMSMLLPAARGETLEQMLSAMRLPADVPEILRQFEELNAPVQSEPPYTLTNANAFWHDADFEVLDTYRQAIQQAFDAAVGELDLKDREAATRIINEWAAFNTQGMIDEVVTPKFFTDTMVFVLANAVYFKGKWVEPFDPERTYDAPFYLADGSTVRVQMMSHTGEYRAHFGRGFRMVVLPYEGDRFSMVVILPDGGDQLDELAQVVTPELLDEWVALAEAEPFYLRLGLPKFELSASLEPIEILKSLGMTNVFSGAADLSGMAGPIPGLMVEEAVHAARIEVSEEGTRAAAVTVVGGGVCSGPPSITVNHPFLFAIRDDQTGAIQFLGQVTNPS